MSVVAVMGMGQTLVMIMGSFDLAQAGIAGLCAMVRLCSISTWEFLSPLR